MQGLDPLVLLALGWLALAVVTAVVWFWTEARTLWRKRDAAPPLPGWPIVTPERGRELRMMPYDDYLQTPEWRQRSVAVRGRAGWRCELCGSRDRLQVHHLTYRRRGDELPADLQVLCGPCHRQAHGHDTPA